MAGITGKTANLAKVLTQHFKETKSFNKVLEKVQILSVGDGKCQAEFTVQPEHENPLGSLHGGYTATLVDLISTYALMTKSHSGLGGVSVDMHISYLKAAKSGETVIVDARMVKTGRTLAFLEVELKNKQTGAIIAKGQHTKFIA